MFTKSDEVRYGLKSLQFIAQPVLFKDDELLMAIQLESKTNKRTNKTLGFHTSDEQVLKIICQFLAMQLEKTAKRKEVNKKEQAIISTLELTSEVCTQRNFGGLLRKMRDYMPQYFGFEAVGVLLYDNKTNWLYTDPSFTAREAEDGEEKGGEQEDLDHGLSTNMKQTPKSDMPESAMGTDADREMQNAQKLKVHQQPSLSREEKIE